MRVSYLSLPLMAATALVPFTALAQGSAAIECAALARYPTFDDPTGSEWADINTDKAIAICLVALELDPTDADARANLARVYIRAERIKEGLRELRVAAEAGSAQAQRQLAIQFEEAGGEENLIEAIVLLRQAADQGYLPAYLTLSDFLTREDMPGRDPEEAFQWAMRGYQAGDSDFANQLGLYYENGTGTPKDFAASTRMFREAAEAGNPSAMRNYALALQAGDGVESDPVAALAWFRRAADAGETDAYDDIGFAYQNGSGVERDDFEAVRWYREGHAAGSSWAAMHLAYMLESGRGVPARDQAAALELYEEAAESGNSQAMLWLASNYSEGTGTTRDYALALEWYRRAADAGEVNAYYYVGFAYERGQGTAKDVTQAIDWYERGRAQGCSFCMTQLGVLHGRGIGFERNQAKADALYLEAAELGDGDAMRKVAQAYRAGRLENDSGKAIEWDRRAAELGIAGYERDFGMWLAFGANGYEIDLPEARKYLERAMSKGDEDAGTYLVLATLADTSLPDREVRAVAVLREQAEHGEGWAIASLAFPSAAFAALAAMPEPVGWRGRLDGVLPEEALFSAANAFKNGRTARQDLGMALELTQRAATGDLLNARGRELEMLMSLSLWSVALRRYAEFTVSEEYLALPADQRASFETRFVSKLETCFRNATAATDTLVELADRGMAESANALGNFYNSKDNPEYNPEAARHWFGRAVELGMTSPLVALGYLHSFGIGGPKDEAKAFEYYLRAAEAGDASGQHNLAVMYDEGRGVEQDRAESVRWLQLASAGGNSTSYARLAANQFKGEGTPVEPTAAIDSLLKVTDLLYGPALHLMAIAHLEGSGVPRDVEMGLRWMRLLAGLGEDAFAPTQMALAYAGAWGTPPDAKQAFRWLGEARARGGDWAAKVLEACADDRTAACIAGSEGFEPYTLMEKPVATRGPLPTLAERENTLLAERDEALSAGNMVAADDAINSLNVLYRLYDEPERLLANNAMNIVSTERQMQHLHGSRENYFSLLTTSCRWARASDAASAVGRAEAAVLFAKVAVNRLQQARGFIADLDDEVRECFIEVHRDRYRELAGLFLDLGRFAEAENVLGMLKDFEFQSYTREAGDRGQSYAAMPLTIAQAEVVERYERAFALYNNDPHEPGFAAAFAELTASLAALEHADRQLIAEGDATDAPSIQDLLRTSGRSDVAALQAVVQPDRIYWIVSGPEMQKVVRVPITIAEMTRQIRNYHEDLSLAGDGLDQQAHSLYEMIFAPVDAELRAMGASEVLLSLDENLRYLPFAALHDGQGWLIERYAFSNFRRPEEIAIRESRSPVPSVAGFGVTEASEGFAALPMVKAEIASIVIDDGDDAGVLPGSARLDEKFDRASLKQAAGEPHGVIHIASHFALDPSQRNRSRLLLGSGQFLHLSDFGQDGGIVFSGSPMVVLSACETAVEVRDASGVELDSLARIVGKAGASTVLASLWQVSDASTADLMARFYRERFVLSLSNGQALRRAHLELIEAGRRGETPAPEGEDPADYATFDNPFFWAPFVVTADIVANEA